MDECAEFDSMNYRVIGKDHGFNSHCGLFELSYKSSTVDGKKVPVTCTLLRNPKQVVIKVMPPYKETLCPEFLLARFWEAEIAVLRCMTNLPRSSLRGGQDWTFNFPYCYAAFMRKQKERYYGIILMQAIVHIPPGKHIIPLAFEQVRVREVMKRVQQMVQRKIILTRFALSGASRYD